MGKELKTNAMRFLDKHKIEYQMHTYESDGFLDGISVAKKLQEPYEKTFKTLVAAGKSKNYYVFVLPVDKELDLKKAAAAAGEKSVDMIPVKDIQLVTGYVRGGCSPIGMKKQYPTIIHQTALEEETIIFSGGRIGTQIEMDARTLIDLLRARTADLAACD